MDPARTNYSAEHTRLVLHLPEPVGWIALTPEALREAQLRARELVGVHRPEAPAADVGGLVSAEEAARALAVDASWLLRSARRREIPFAKVGKYVRFDLKDLRAHLAKGPTK
jgi:excisionase family DNA binding protein